MAITPGLGTVLSTSPDGTTWTALAARVTIDGPSGEMGTVETTTLDSTTKSYRSTIFDGGELSGQCFFDPADTTHVNMITLNQAGTVTHFKLAFASVASHTAIFLGIITQFAPGGMEVESNLTFDYTIKLSGGCVYA